MQDGEVPRFTDKIQEEPRCHQNRHRAQDDHGGIDELHGGVAGMEPCGRFEGSIDKYEHEREDSDKGQLLQIRLYGEQIVRYSFVHILPQNGAAKVRFFTLQKPFGVNFAPYLKISPQNIGIYHPKIPFNTLKTSKMDFCRSFANFLLQNHYSLNKNLKD